MNVLLLLVSAVLGGILLACEKRFYNPAVYLIFFYGITGFFAGTGILNLYQPDNAIYWCYIIGLGSITGGYILARSVRVISPNDRFELRRRTYLIIAGLVLIFGVVKLVIIAPLLMQNVSLGLIRSVYNGNVINGISFSPMIYRIEVYFCKPMLHILSAVFALMITDKTCVDGYRRIMLIISGLGIVVNQFVSAGRMAVFVLLIMMVVSCELNYNNSVFSFLKKHKGILVLGIILVGFMYWISFKRTGDTHILDSIYIYFCGPSAFMAENMYRLSGDNYIRTYGLTLISGFVRPIYIVYRAIVGTEIPLVELIYEINTSVNEYKYISPTINFNAFVTLFYYFFMDGGYLGVVIDSFFFSWFSNHFYFKQKRSPSLRNKVLFLIALESVVLSFVRYQYVDVSNVLPFVYIYVCFQNKKSSHNQLILDRTYIKSHDKVL